MTNVGQRSVQGSVAQGIRDAWDKFGEPSGRHVEVLMWMVLYVCLKKLALSVNCYLLAPCYLIIFGILVWGQVVLSLDGG